MPEAPIPPPAFSAYPRGDVAPYGTSEKLSRLYRGYVQIAYGYLLIIVGFFVSIFGMAAFSPDGNTILGVFLLILGLAGVGYGFYLCGKSGADIGYGMGWNKGIGVAAGVIGPFIGLIALIIIQMLAIQEMKNYGIAVKPFRGLKKKDVLAKIAEMTSAESATYQNPPSSTA